MQCRTPPSLLNAAGQCLVLREEGYHSDSGPADPRGNGEQTDRLKGARCVAVLSVCTAVA